MDAIMEWGTALFFIWYGLAAFVPALNTDMFKKVGGGLASWLVSSDCSLSLVCSR